MYKVKLKLMARCPRHKKFNPEVDGPGAVKGNCRLCLALLELHKQVDGLKRAFVKVNEGGEQIGLFSEPESNGIPVVLDCQPLPRKK